MKRWVHNFDADRMQLIGPDGTAILSQPRWSEVDQHNIMIAMSKAARQCGGACQSPADPVAGWQRVLDAKAPNGNGTFQLRNFAARAIEVLAA